MLTVYISQSDSAWLLQQLSWLLSSIPLVTQGGGSWETRDSSWGTELPCLPLLVQQG